MIDYLSIVEADKVNHDVAKIESFGMSADELDKETGSSDGLQLKQADLSCVHALNEPHLHEIHVVPKYGMQLINMFMSLSSSENLK
ncbi:hypothetical protein Tco_0894545 [Tanacetum coccineum]|uniref:Uncharacterized protein n=1 Tax=Tanacetum coccineum TaxID=301880 RepID=A0ABQ5CDC5_9ASTR